MWFYLASDIRWGGPEAEARRGVLLLLHAFDAGTEMELHVETLLWGDVLREEIYIEQNINDKTGYKLKAELL